MKTLLITILILLPSFLFSQNATEIIKKTYEKSEGKSQYAEMTMQIVRPKWQREVTFKLCNLGTDYSLVLITGPVKDKGQTYLKVKDEMWMWNPTVSSVVKLGPSMMSQGWMNSDYSNDELLNSGSIIDDYNHKLVGSELIENIDCYKIEITPKDDKMIIWGKQVFWITKTSNLIMKNEFYDEDGFLVKTHISGDVKNMDGKELPTRFEIISEDNPNSKTVLIMNYINFDVKVDESFFNQQNMRKGMSIIFPKQ